MTELFVREEPQSVKSPVKLVNVHYEQGTCFRPVFHFLEFLLKLGEELGIFSENEPMYKHPGVHRPQMEFLFAMITYFLT